MFDREKFAELVTNELKKFPNLTIINKEFTEINSEDKVVLATGPLTSGGLMKALGNLLGEEYLYFFDAIAPIVSHDSIDFNSAFIQDRYQKGTGDYINCPMDKEEYELFYNELINGEIVKFSFTINQGSMLCQGIEGHFYNLVPCWFNKIPLCRRMTQGNNSNRAYFI